MWVDTDKQRRSLIAIVRPPTGGEVIIFESKIPLDTNRLTPQLTSVKLH